MSFDDFGETNRGRLIVFLGTDGAGKSTILSKVESTLVKRGIDVQTYYFAPGFLRRYRPTSPAVANTSPHEGRQYGPFLVILKILLMLFEFNAGVLRARRANEIVLFDRFIHDLLVDPIRYRMNSVRWWMRILLKLAPSPDLIIILSASAEVVHQRKQEVSFEETERQIEAYKALAARFPRSLVIENTDTVEAAAQTALDAIFAL